MIFFHTKCVLIKTSQKKTTYFRLVSRGWAGRRFFKRPGRFQLFVIKVEIFAEWKVKHLRWEERIVFKRQFSMLETVYAHGSSRNIVTKLFSLTSSRTGRIIIFIKIRSGSIIGSKNPTQWSPGRTNFLSAARSSLLRKRNINLIFLYQVDTVLLLQFLHNKAKNLRKKTTFFRYGISFA